jgi:choline dehydrogenase-like flavoprotein
VRAPIAFEIARSKISHSDGGIYDVRPYRVVQRLRILTKWFGLQWNHTIIPQPGADNRSIAWPRGRVLGGSSALNVSLRLKLAFQALSEISELSSKPG